MKRCLEIVKEQIEKWQQLSVQELESLYPEGVLITKRQSEIIDNVVQLPHIPFIIYGETGTGKDLMAKLVHHRRMKITGEAIPFVAVNCSHLNSELATSLLFGHAKGSFSGATASTEGYIGHANGGILFLDEIHTLTIECQQKLLRVLNDGSYHRVGETKEHRSTFQLIVASTQNMDALVENGKILPDLRGRIFGLELALCPLRERKADVPILVSMVLSKYNITVPTEIFNELVSKCCHTSWPGNIRQMMRAVETLTALSALRGGEINASDLSLPKVQEKNGEEIHALNLPSLVPVDDLFLFNFVSNILDKKTSFEAAIEQVERTLIGEAIKRHKNHTGVIKALDLARSSYSNKVKKYGLQV